MFRFNFHKDEADQEDIVAVDQQQDCAEEPCREIPVSAILPECDFKPIKVDNVEFFIRDLASEKEETNREFMNSYKDCDVIPTIYEGKKL
ncbi:hypothetical protein V9T40_009657 [Parthenolecanium corni]|uniref:Uncharacterized protein n=1 Tax=Parthenolecanium corni TaxID=536013 RepID=A0AAN9TQ87_9HEMI